MLYSTFNKWSRPLLNKISVVKELSVPLDLDIISAVWEGGERGGGGV